MTLRAGRGPVIPPIGDFRGFLPAEGFNPAQVSGLVDWHRADQGLTLVGSKVSAWADLSGNGHHLTQGTDAVRPSLVDGVIGGRPVVRFGLTAADRHLKWTPWAQSTDGTVYAVARYRSSGTAQRSLVTTDGAKVLCDLSWETTGLGKPTIEYTSGRMIHSTAMVDGSDHLVKWAWRFSSSPTVYIQVDSGTEESQAANAGTNDWEWFGVMNDGTSFETIWDLAEYMIYSRRLTTIEESMIRAYVTDTYGVS